MDTGTIWLIVGLFVLLVFLFLIVAIFFINNKDDKSEKDKKTKNKNSSDLSSDNNTNGANIGSNPFLFGKNSTTNNGFANGGFTPPTGGSGTHIGGGGSSTPAGPNQPFPPVGRTYQPNVMTNLGSYPPTNPQATQCYKEVDFSPVDFSVHRPLQPPPNHIPNASSKHLTKEPDWEMSRHHVAHAAPSFQTPITSQSAPPNFHMTSRSPVAPPSFDTSFTRSQVSAPDFGESFVRSPMSAPAFPTPPNQFASPPTMRMEPPVRNNPNMFETPPVSRGRPPVEILTSENILATPCSEPVNLDDALGLSNCENSNNGQESLF